MKKILIVDDSRTIVYKASKMLKGAGYDVITAEDGFDAISKITEQQPDIIFIDIVMPRLDGYQTCALIKNNHAYRDIPIIMVSSKDGLFDRARGRVVGAEGYINKPFDDDDLINMVKKYV